MKKYFIGILLLIISLFMVPNITYVQAEELDDNQLKIDTLYPDGVLDYHNLTNISQMSVGDNYIAYTLDKTSINIFNKETKTTVIANTFNNIYDLKYVNNNQLIVVDYNEESCTGNIKVVTINNDTPTIITLESINITNLRLIDIYNYNNIVYIGLIRNTDTNNVFELYTIDNINSLSTPVFHHSIESSYYNTANQLVINNENQYVVYEYESNSRILINSHSAIINSTPVSILNNIQKLKYYYDGTNEYLLAFTEEILYLLNSQDYTSATKYFSNDDMKIIKFTDIDIYNNEIIICDTENKLIKSFVLNINDNITLSEKSLLLSSSDTSLGRFNNASNIYVQGDTLYISDTKNNRIQIINNSTCHEINDLETDSNPYSVLLDSHQNIYFTIENTNSNTSSILKYTQDNNTYTKTNTYSTYNDNSIGMISDSTIDINDVIYFIDYTNNNLLYLTSAGIQLKTHFDTITTSKYTKIDYLINSNKLVIYNDNTLYLINPETFAILDSITIDNCTDITVDYSNILALTNNEIKLISVDSESAMHISEKSLINDTFVNFTCITFDIINNQIYAFNNYNQSINYFDCDLTINPFNFDNINSSTALTQDNTPFALNIISNGLIYDNPYYLGNFYSNITSCIGIEEYDRFYRVLFNYNNTLQVGFIDKNYTETETYNTSKKIRVIATNLQIPVYKYPTILKYDSQAVIIDYIPISTYINVSYNSFPITIDGHIFYLYSNNGDIGYIFNADIVLDDSKHITYLHTENATISAIGKDEIHIYDEDKTTILLTLANDDRIYVESYDKNSEYTKVIYKDSDLNTIEGYILTDYIEMDKLDNFKITLILIIVFSVVMLAVIIISYVVIKKRK